ncbi:hypothetical protein FHL15_008834 [Xylaria flabelliformis]|uniref:Uncharacterized protein n=1 Tax=Xylaria flabelliformis TaxID=2512241 RepID=A0A553HQR9_9PEZI|nr:hypothetical protein FHL15_008834 [Xylaria flabelliformis]
MGSVYFTTVRFPDPEASLSDNTVIAWPLTAGEWLNCVAAKALFALGYPRRAFLLAEFFRLGTGLVEVFLDFACNMYQIILGTSHPLSILIQKFNAVRAESLVPCIKRALQYYEASTIKVDSRPITESYGIYYKDIIYGSFFDESLVLRHLQSLQNHLQSLLEQQVQGSPESDYYLLGQVHALQCRIAWIRFYAEQHEEATKLVIGILSEPLVNARVISGCGCYDILYEAAVAKNDHDLALDIL